MKIKLLIPKKWLLYPFFPFIVFHLKFFFMCDYDISRKMLTKFCVSNFIFTREKLKNMIFLILKMSTLHTALLTMPIKAIGKAVFKFYWCTLFYILSLRGRNGINQTHWTVTGLQLSTLNTWPRCYLINFIIHVSSLFLHSTLHCSCFISFHSVHSSSHSFHLP